MQSEKGITLISITIYVIVMLIVVSVITILTQYFYKNVDVNSVNEDFNQQYTKFNSYFSEEINKEGNKVAGIGDLEGSTEGAVQKYILFSSGNQYTFIENNHAIYMNNVKIAENIESCSFTLGTESNKTTITVMIKGENAERTTTYTLVE